MALRELKTNLTSLRWGNDTPGGGDSGLPYIKTPLPENSNTLEYIALESAKYSSDFPIRGGLYQVRASAEDALRIRKFLTDFPKGSNFTQKQVGLQKSNPLIETGKNGGRINTQTYNLNTNLLFSVLTSGTGEHYPRIGSNMFTLLEDDNKYASIVGKQSTENNRLFTLYQTKINGDYSNTLQMESLGISLDDNILFNYLGGPGSTYGDGETIIMRSTDSRGVIINTNKPLDWKSVYIEDPSLNILPILGPTKYLRPIMSDEDLNIFDEKILTKQNEVEKPSLSSLYSPRYVIGSNIQDFRKNNPNAFSRDYSNPNTNIQTRVGIGSPGARVQRNNINEVFTEGQDKVNMSPIYYGENDIPVEKDDSKNNRDLIKFAIEVIDNNNPNYTYRTHFRAFLTGFSDSNSSNWNTNKYSGRGDNLYNYTGFQRKISFKFTVLAQSKQEMIPMWKRLNYLNSTLMPDYGPNGFMRGNIHRITIGEYLYRMPGVITSLNFSIKDNYPWEIKMDESENGFDSDMMELPHLIDVEVSFTPIYDELPRTISLFDYNFGALISNKVGNTENFISQTSYPFEQSLGR